MKPKSPALHFEILTRSSKPSGYIRSSYRENGKVKHTTVSCINGCTLDQLKSMKAAFDGKAIKLDDVKTANGREFGGSSLLFNLAKRIGLDKAIVFKDEAWARMCMAMTIGRIVYQGSKLSLVHCADYSCLWDICGAPSPEVNDPYPS